MTVTDAEINSAAVYLPMTGPDELPAIQVGGPVVFAYWEDGLFRVSVDLDDALTELTPIQICVGVSTVFNSEDPAPGSLEALVQVRNQEDAWRANRIAQIRAAGASGRSTRWIGDLVGLSPQGVANILNKAAA